MTVRVTKKDIDVREKISKLDRPIGVAGESMIRAETPQEQFNLIGAGRKNIVINGDMRIAQRGTSSTGTGFQTVDRFKPANTTSSTVTQSQGSSSPPPGFNHYLRINADTADTSLGSSEYHLIQHAVEGYNAIQTGWGTDNAVPLTLSFWVRSNVPGIFCVEIQTSSSYESSHNYTIDNADTWEYKTITFPPHNQNNVNKDNSAAFYIMFWQAAGSTFNTGTISNLWTTDNSGRASGQVNLLAKADNYFDLTGVQLELGSTATPFEHRSYSEELMLCKRYYHRLSGDLGDQYAPITFWMESTGAMKGAYEYPTEMRDTPTITVSGSWTIDGGTSGNPSVTLLNNHQATAGKSACRFEFLGSFDARDGGILAYGSGGVIQFDADY